MAESSARLKEDDISKESPRNLQNENFGRFLERFLRIWRSLESSTQYESLFSGEKDILALEATHSTGGENTVTRSFEIRISFIRFEESQALAIIFSETTHRKTIQTLQDQDAYRSKLLATVSHELRTPLNGSTNFIERVYEDDRVPQELKNVFLLPAIRSNRLLMSLINDILDMSQLKADRLRLNFEVNDILSDIQEALQLVEIQAKFKKLRLLCDCPAYFTEYDFCTDHQRVKQILLNLLSNAIKFTREGYVKVRLSQLDVGTECSRQLKIEVEDTGIGISIQEQKKLFGEFTHIEGYDRKDLNPHGVGLGLMIANSLAQVLGPNESPVGIQVISTPGIGSIFSFVLEEKVENKPQKQTFKRSRALNEDELTLPNTSDDSSPRKLVRSSSNTVNFANAPTSKFAPSMRRAPTNQQTISKVITKAFTKALSKKYTLQPEDPLRLNTTPEFRGPKVTLNDSFVTLIPEEKRMETEFGKYLQMIDEESPLSIKRTDSNIPLNDLACRCPDVLVVDDESFNILAVESILKGLEIKCDRAFTGAEAVHMALKRAGSQCGTQCHYYKLILMDCQMPVMDGFTAAREIRELMNTSKIPKTYIVACSALAQSDDVKQALECGMDEYCVKPISKSKILQIISHEFAK